MGAIGFNHPDVSSPPDSADEEVLIALHGLGANGLIWRPVLAHQPKRWPAWWYAPDLPGHGVATWAEHYSFDSMAHSVAGGLPEARSYAVLGHSLGGVVALALAAIEPRVRRVVGLGIKVEWTDDELAWARAQALRPVAWFDTEAEAVARYRKVSGVGELVDDKIARAGVSEEDGRWRLALDPKAFGVGRPDLVGLLGDCPADVMLARGEHDHMVTDAQLAALVAEPVTLPGLGHNAHLEDPAAVLALL